MSTANPSQDVIEKTFGPLVTGQWIQQLLLGFIVAQMIDYYRMQFEMDNKFNKIIVSLLLFFNLILGGTDFHVLYRATVQHYGVYELFDLQEWTMWTEPGWTAIIGFISQTFFLMRCWRVGNSKLVVMILSALVLFSFGCGLAVSGSFIKYQRFSTLGQFSIPITLWLISTSVADLGIALVLVYYLLEQRTSFKKTDAVLYRLIQLTMETSSLTALIAVLNLVLFLPLQDTAYHLLPQFPLSRIYTITVMSTLLTRTSLRAVLDSTDHASFATAFREANNMVDHIRVTTTIMDDSPDRTVARSNKDGQNIELGEVGRDADTTHWDNKHKAL